MTDLRRHVARLRPLMWLAVLGAGVACEAAGPQPAPEEAAWVWEGLDATAVSVGVIGLCALDQQGLATCTGTETTGITEAPTLPLRRVEVGARSACGLTPDGTILCWGCGYYETPEGKDSIDEGQCLAPVGEFTDVTVGMWRACAVATDSTAQCWGRPLENGAADPISQGMLDLSYDQLLCGVRTGGQLECWSDPWDDPPQPPDGEFSAVEVGGGGACAARTSGDFTCFGVSVAGAYPTTIRDVAKLDTGDASTCVIRRSDGGLECVGMMADWPTPVGRYIDVAVGYNRAYAVREDGLLVGWGDFSPPDTGGTVD